MHRAQPLRSAVVAITLLSCVPALVFGQSGERPIYLYQGQGDSKEFRWADRPIEATAYVFRKPVPEGEEEGQIIARVDEETPSLEKVARRLPVQEEHFADSTALAYRGHPTFDVEAIGTQDEYPAQAQGTDVRYFLLIEHGERVYASRTLGSRRGNLPRYYALGNPAHVRVGEVHPKLRSRADTLLERVRSRESIAERSASDGPSRSSARSDVNSKAGDDEGKGSGTTTRSLDQSRSTVGTSLSWAQRLGLLGDVGFFFAIVLGGGAALVALARVFVTDDPSAVDSRAAPEDEAAEETALDEEEKSTWSASSERDLFEAEEGPSGEHSWPYEDHQSEERREPSDSPDVGGASLDGTPSAAHSESGEEEGRRGRSKSPDAGEEEKSLAGTSEGATAKTPAPKPPSESERRTVRTAVVPAFRDWCQEGRPLPSILSRFEWFLEKGEYFGEMEGKDLHLESWHVERDGSAGLASPDGASHWAVKVGRTPVALLPRPEEESFRSLRGFEGEALPSQLIDIEPAWLVVREGRTEVLKTGRVERS